MYHKEYFLEILETDCEELNILFEKIISALKCWLLTKYLYNNKKSSFGICYSISSKVLKKLKKFSTDLLSLASDF